MNLDKYEKFKRHRQDFYNQAMQDFIDGKCKLRSVKKRWKKYRGISRVKK